MRWLYENQGVRRFDWSNRLYLVLANCADYFGSWKLKRARELLVSRIHANLDRIAAHPGHRVRFNWDGEKYTATAELILIAHGTVPELKRLARGKCDCSL
jgi:hypothetical protein